MKWMKMLIVLLMLAASVAIAQAGDGDPPPVEDVCDVVKYGTPGLYGLCIAFCEAQDCEPDLSAADPFEKCRPGSERVLANYRKKMGAGDPDMPCMAAPCPCWAEDELANLMFPQSDDVMSCRKDLDGIKSFNRYTWTVRRSNRDRVIVTTYQQRDSYLCAVSQRCPDRSCDVNLNRILWISADEFATCEAQLAQSGADRGFDCFLD